MSALTPGESTDSRRVDVHVEALAKITCADDHENCGYAAWDDAPEGIREYHRGHASAILASDWLADVVAQAEQRGSVNAMNALRDDLARHDAELVVQAKAETWDEAIATVERQTNLSDLVHFDKPSDFRKGVLTSLMALRAAREATS